MFCFRLMAIVHAPCFHSCLLFPFTIVLFSSILPVLFPCRPLRTLPSPLGTAVHECHRAWFIQFSASFFLTIRVTWVKRSSLFPWPVEFVRSGPSPLTPSFSSVTLFKLVPSPTPWPFRRTLLKLFLPQSNLQSVLPPFFPLVFVDFLSSSAHTSFSQQNTLSLYAGASLFSSSFSSLEWFGHSSP